MNIFMESKLLSDKISNCSCNNAYYQPIIPAISVFIAHDPSSLPSTTITLLVSRMPATLLCKSEPNSLRLNCIGSYHSNFHFLPKQ